MTMNHYDVEAAAKLLADDPIMGPASKYLFDYMELINDNSDGWAYWEKGRKPSEDLQGLVAGAMAQKRGFRPATVKPTTEQDVLRAVGKIERFVKNCDPLQERKVSPPVLAGFETPGQQEYRVTWTIDVSASSPREAAELALEIQRDPNSIATSFMCREVTRSYMPNVVVDLREGATA